MRLLFPVVVVLLGIYFWRVRRILSSSPNLPLGYYNKGNFATQCSRPSAEQLKYCEDVAFWDQFDSVGQLQKRSAVLSCDAGRKDWNVVIGPRRNPEPHGSLWIHVPKEKADPQRLTLKNYPVGHDFHPIGIQVSPSHAGNVSNMYVVNHARQRTYVEHFVLNPSSPTIATHVRTISSPHVHTANSLALTSANSFYVTNDHYFTPRLSVLGPLPGVLETYLTLPLGWVSHLTLDPDHNTQNPVKHHAHPVPFISFPNGVAVSPDGSRVAVASSTTLVVHLYKRDPTNNSLRLIDNIRVPFIPDNLAYDDEGTLIVAGVPSLKALHNVAFNKTQTDASPAWIVSVKEISQTRARNTIPPEDFDLLAPVPVSSKVSGSYKYTFETLFQSNGTGYPTATTGLLDSKSGTLYLAGIYAEDGVMICGAQELHR